MIAIPHSQLGNLTMLITKKRILNLDRYIKTLDGKKIILSFTPSSDKTLEKIGFSKGLEVGDTLLPKPCGPISRFNAHGKYKINKDLPKEKAYRQVSWTWKQYSGRNQQVEVTQTKAKEYYRYHRDFISPPSIELSVKNNKHGEILVISPELTLSIENKDLIIHTINLILEINGECEILQDNLNSYANIKKVRLNWQILPKGEIPWNKSEAVIKKALSTKKKNNNKVIESRLDEIGKKSPSFIAIGQAGFGGYVIFGFEKKNLYVLESSQVNNATYIFEDDWKMLSTLSKAEILNDNLHHARIIHRSSWFAEIDKILS